MRFLVAAVSILVGTGAAAGQTLRQEIERQNASMMEAWKRNDTRAVSSHYSDDARIVGPSGRAVVGRGNVDAYWGGFPMEGRTWTLDVLEAGGTHDLAYQLGRSSISGGSRSQVVDFVGIWRRQSNGELKLALDFWLPTGRQSQPQDSAALRSLDARWARSYAEHDTAFALALFAEEIAVTAANGNVKTKQGELADVRAQPGLVMDFFRTRDVNVRTFGDAGVVNGLAEWSFTWNGRKGTNARHYIATYARGGPLGWRMVSLQLIAVR